MLVSLSIPKFAQRSLRMLANFGIGTLAKIGPVHGRRPSLDSVSNEKNRRDTARKRPAMKSYVVGRLDEFASEGSRKVISCDGTEIGVFKIDGELVAWHNQCAHLQGPVCQGRIYAKVEEPI